jgi:hypothetical protein
MNVKGIMNGEEKRIYEKQTISGVFFFIKGEIIKSPAHQPKFQIIDIENVKSGFDLIEKFDKDILKVTENGSFGYELSEKELKISYKKDWDLYEKEFHQMQVDLGLIKDDSLELPKKKTSKKVESKRKSVQKKVVKKKTKKLDPNLPLRSKL